MKKEKCCSIDIDLSNYMQDLFKAETSLLLKKW